MDMRITGNNLSVSDALKRYTERSLRDWGPDRVGTFGDSGHRIRKAAPSLVSSDKRMLTPDDLF